MIVAADTAKLCIADVPISIATTMKVADSFRIVRLFKIAIEQPFLVSTHCSDNTEHKREVEIH